MSKIISMAEYQKLKLKGKPKCPYCGNPVHFVYEGSRGFTSQKCPNCNRASLVNNDTLEVYKIVK